MNRLVFAVLGFTFNIFVTQCEAADFDITIPIQEKGAMTYYVAGLVGGFGDAEFMVDTGSGYTAINENMLDKLRKGTHVEFLATASATLANGDRTTLPVYKIDSISIGSKCVIQDVKAVILPGSTRNILGLNALKKVAPFAFSTNPPSLLLSNCVSGVS